jgi:hypothetical protein
MRVACNTSPIQGVCNRVSDLERQITALEGQGGVDLSDYVQQWELQAGLDGKSDISHDHPDYVTDSELTSGLAGKSDVGHTHPAEGGMPYTIVKEITGIKLDGDQLFGHGASGFITGIDISVPIEFGQYIVVSGAVTPYKYDTWARCDAQVYVDVDSGVHRTLVSRAYLYRTDTRFMTTLPIDARFYGMTGPTSVVRYYFVSGQGQWRIYGSGNHPAQMTVQVRETIE